MKVQLGSGNRPIEGWVNVDLYNDTADIKADIREVQFDKRTVDEVVCIHTIEHITLLETRDLIARIARWLKPKGRVTMETPDRKKCLNLIDEGAGLLGAKGLLGGRSIDKDGWHKWLTQWAATKNLEQKIKEHNVGWVEIPPPWFIPGEQHLHCWEGHELAWVMEEFGLKAKVGDPKCHGNRAWRDTRVVGVKP